MSQIQVLKIKTRLILVFWKIKINRPLQEPKSSESTE